MKKYTFCDDWTKIVAQSWFCARIYPRALTLGRWPLNFRIKILKYSFSLVFVKKICPIRRTVQKIIGDELVTDRQQTDRQQTDRQQTNIFELTPIHKKTFFFHMGGRTNGGKFIPPCLLRKFALLTCFARRGIMFL